MGLLGRLVPSGSRATKIIDGVHPTGEHAHAMADAYATTTPDMLPLDGAAQTKSCNILVAVTGNELDRELVTLGCTLAQKKKAEAFAVYGIEVPRTLPVDAELDDATEQASEVLERATAVADQMNVHIAPEIVQSRHFGQSLVDEAAAHSCALLIVGLPYKIGRTGHFDISDTVDFVLKNAPCKVWVVRGKPTPKDMKAQRHEQPAGARA